VTAPPDGVLLRPRRNDDDGFLAELYASTRADEMALVEDWTEEQKNTFLAMQFEAQTKHYDEHFSDAEFLIVERGDEPIGRLYLHRRQDEIRVVDIALLPQHRRSGIGGRLMREVLDEAARSGRVVRIHVERNNPAMRLYERLGFLVVDDLEVYLLMEWSSAEP